MVTFICAFWELDPAIPGFGLPPTANMPPSEMGSSQEVTEKPKKKRKKKKKPAESNDWSNFWNILICVVDRQSKEI